MASSQTAALRTVLGAYSKTSTRSLELDAFCPPLDIYLNKRLADFERRMQASGLSQKLNQATSRIAARLKRRKPRRGRRPQLEGCHWEWAKEWTGSTSPGTPRPPWLEIGNCGERPRAMTHPPGLIKFKPPARLKAATSGYIKTWPKRKARRCARPGRKRSAYARFCSNGRSQE